MRMIRIEVRRMFGEIDLDIPLNVDERMTIIHGPNGCGKSSLFRLLDRVFNPHDSDPTDFHIAFESLTCTYDNGSQLIVTPFSEHDPAAESLQQFSYGFVRNLAVPAESFQPAGISESMPAWAKEMMIHVVLINTPRDIRLMSEKDSDGLTSSSRVFMLSAEACLTLLNGRLRYRGSQRPVTPEGLLLQELINQRLTNKLLMMNTDNRLAFVDKQGNPLSPRLLSSGEQHLFLIFCALLGSADHSLILLDEPEISLHVAWQQKFLQDLQAIMVLRPIDVMIATHSPLIIRDKWDLTVDLGGHENA